MPRCTLILTGAPLAKRSVDVIVALQQAGYEVDLVATDAAKGWVDIGAVSTATGTVSRTHSLPDAASPRVPLPDVAVVCPATFNTINKVAQGIADTRTHSFLCECIGAGVSLLFVPMINERLWDHPALRSSIEMLSIIGSVFLDLQTGNLNAVPVVSGTGARVVADFDPAWIVARLAARS